MQKFRVSPWSIQLVPHNFLWTLQICKHLFWVCDPSCVILGKSLNLSGPSSLPLWHMDRKSHPGSLRRLSGHQRRLRLEVPYKVRDDSTYKISAREMMECQPIWGGQRHSSRQDTDSLPCWCPNHTAKSLHRSPNDVNGFLLVFQSTYPKTVCPEWPLLVASLSVYTKEGADKMPSSQTVCRGSYPFPLIYKPC